MLMNLVDDILDMSKFNANTFQPNINPFKLSDLLKDIDYIFGFQWAEKHIDFSIDCAPSTLGATYMTDNKRIKQVLINLVSNSFKFTERGGIGVKVRELQRDGASFLKFEVSDTGVGISREDVPRLFKLFGMLSKHRSRLNQSGSGLGLSISKRIVESLGGKIKVTSRENELTKFTFLIKCNKEELSLLEENKELFENSQNSNKIQDKSMQKLNEEVKVSHKIFIKIALFILKLKYVFIL